MGYRPYSFHFRYWLFLTICFLSFFPIGTVWAKDAIWGAIANPLQRFQTLGSYNNEAVWDRETGLVWERVVYHQTSNSLVSAIQTCRFYRGTGGKLGWRLPTVEEMMSLFKPIPGEQGSRYEAPDANVFNYNPDPATFLYFWTATTDATDPNKAYAFFTSPETGGTVGLTPLPKASDINAGRAWCVRGGSTPENP